MEQRMAEDIETDIKTTLHWTTRHVNIAIKFLYKLFLYRIGYMKIFMYEN